MRPTLIVVSGPPASGKTTLAHAIARAVPCPAISRDEIKEGLGPGDGPPVPGDTATRHATAVFFEVVGLMIQRGVSLVGEAAFQYEVWAPKIHAWSEHANIRIVRCTVDGSTVRDRLIRRVQEEPQRKTLHADAMLIQRIERGEVSLEQYRPLQLDVPTFVVDTSDGYRPGLDDVVSFATT